MHTVICATLLAWLSVTAHAATDGLVENNNEDFLAPEQAFMVDIRPLSQHQVQASFKVAPGYYLYKQRLHARAGSDQAAIVETALPPAQTKDDPNFGKSEIYHDRFSVAYGLKPSAIAPASLPFTIEYQGCSEQGLCYPPMRKTVQLHMADAIDRPLAGQVATSGNTAAVAEAPKDEVGTLLQGGDFLLVIAGFFGFGLLLSLTPCVFPMIPILSSIIVGQNASASRMSSFYLSLAYTMGMALSYTIAGIVAGLSGNMISNALQTPAVMFSSAAVFALLSLSMFGLYELKLPAFIEFRVMDRAQKMQGGKLLSVFVMGALSALVVSPCVAAPLAGALIYIGQTHDVVLGAVALFCLSLGMGVPLLIIGASAGALLPRAGLWMVAVRNFFGVLMLAMAIWLMSAHIQIAVQMALWGTLLVVVAIYLGALDSVNTEKSKWPVFWKGIGVAVLFVGFSMFVGALSGRQSVLQPLSGFKSALSTIMTVPAESLKFQKVSNQQELEAAVHAAAGKYVMLDFYADWCTACKELEHMTFSQPDVKKRLDQLQLIQVDVTHNTAQQLALLKQFSLFGPPGMAFYDPQGKELKAHKIVGFMDSDSFKQRLDMLMLAHAE